jgi:hypothetical protein
MTAIASTLPRFAMLLAAALLVGACGKVTAENYAKIKVGMTYEEATKVLGSPASCSDMAGFKACKWGDDKRSITIRFVADKVAVHSADNIR